MYKKGSIILTPFPFTDFSGTKVRPAIILSSKAYGDDVIVAFISSRKKNRLLETEVLVQPDKNNGLKTSSNIKLTKIATLDKKIVLGELGIIDNKNLAKINQKIRKILEL